MTLYQKFLANQREAQEQGVCAEALRSFDPDKTVTLHDLLISPAPAPLIQRLGAESWLRVSQLRKRIKAYCEYMHWVPREVLRKEGAIFFQPVDKALEYAYYRQDVNRAEKESSWKVRTLHTRTVFSSETLGSWEEGRRMIMPGTTFINSGAVGLTQRGQGQYVRSGSLIGYRVPNYADILKVSPYVATDYFVRIIIHDLGHTALPIVLQDREILHDVSMVWAMDARQTTYPNTHEGMVHRECTDPYMFLDADDLHTDDTQPARAAHRVLYNDILAKFSPETLKPSAGLWSLTEEIESDQARKHVTDELKRIRSEGFLAYGVEP